MKSSNSSSFKESIFRIFSKIKISKKIVKNKSNETQGRTISVEWTGHLHCVGCVKREGCRFDVCVYLSNSVFLSPSPLSCRYILPMAPLSRRKGRFLHRWDLPLGKGKLVCVALTARTTMCSPFTKQVIKTILSLTFWLKLNAREGILY